MADELEAALEALRARGAGRVDPVRLRFLEALARRAAGRAGAGGQALAERFAQRVAEFAARLDETASRGDGGIPLDASGPGPLARLVSEFAPHPARHPADRIGAPARALAHARRTWSRLAAEQRIAQSRAALPGNAGPLNSHQLVHRALTQMRTLSPAYFERFVMQVDALQWIADANKG